MKSFSDPGQFILYQLILRLSSTKNLAGEIGWHFLDRSRTEFPDGYTFEKFQKIDSFESIMSTMRYFDLNEFFPRVFWSSLFIATYAAVESHFDLLCDVIRQPENQRILPADLKRKGLLRAERYLGGVIGLDFPSETQSWKYLVDAACVRNCLVHSDGRVRSDNVGAQLNTFKVTHRSLLSVHDKQIRPTQGLVIECIDHAIEFVREFTDRNGTIYGVKLSSKENRIFLEGDDGLS